MDWVPDRYVRERDPFYVLAKSDPEFCRKYDIETWQPLGSGSAGIVVRLRHRIRQRDVAIKLFHEQRDDTIGKIAQEVHVSDKVRSDKVVQMYTPERSEKMTWIEMEYIDGPTLRAHIDQHTREHRMLSLSDAAAFGLAVVEGVRDLHAAGIVHRDLKPQNIILPNAGQAKAKISDFGISRLRDEERATQTGEWRGTPAYAAPELFAPAKGEYEGQRQVLTPASDIYSLGMVLYETFTGRYAYPGVDMADPWGVVAAHMKGTATTPSKHNPEISEELDGLLLRMLAKTPSERPTIGEVLEVVGRAKNPRLVVVTAALAAELPAVAPAASMPAVEAPATDGRADDAPHAPRHWRRGMVSVAGAAFVVVILYFLRGPQVPAGVPAIELPTPIATARPTEAPSATPAAAVVTSAPVVAAELVPPPVLAPTATPKATATAARKDFDLKMEAEGVILRNDSGESVTGIDITLRSSSGGQYRAKSEDRLAPQMALMMPLVLFEPEVPEGTRFRQLDVVIRHTPSGKKTLTLPLK